MQLVRGPELLRAPALLLAPYSSNGEEEEFSEVRILDLA
jgi:hypothetical protein